MMAWYGHLNGAQTSLLDFVISLVRNRKQLPRDDLKHRSLVATDKDSRRTYETESFIIKVRCFKPAALRKQRTALLMQDPVTGDIPRIFRRSYFAEHLSLRNIRFEDYKKWNERKFNHYFDVHLYFIIHTFVKLHKINSLKNFDFKYSL